MGVTPGSPGAPAALASSLSFAPADDDDGTSRALVESWLHVVPLDDTARRDVLVVVSELLTNARHYGARGSVRVDCRAASGRLRVAVRNAETVERVPPKREWVMPDPLAASGRGLAIVARLADAVDVRRGRGAVEIAATFRWNHDERGRRRRDRRDDDSITAS